MNTSLDAAMLQPVERGAYELTRRNSGTGV